MAMAQQYNFIQYSVQEGLPNAKVSNLYQDSKAYLWIATQGGGVARFDGEAFNVIKTKDGLPSNFANVVFEGKQGSIWVGTQKGIAKLKNQKVEKTILEEREVHTIKAKNDSILWLGTDKVRSKT